jgi:hypothetical protein
MTVSVEDFLAAYPEFTPLSEEQTGLVAAVLERAERRIGDSWESNIRNDIVELQAAHLLAMTPAGRSAKLSEPGVKTAYEEDLMLRKKAHAFARMRIV